MPKPAKHKRKRAKNRRSGCLYCKPFKMGRTTPSFGDLRRAREESTRGHGKGN